ncbi:hypothetical protein [Leisingera aquimarina]|uniref:hypothetical protein n=1 Tax=Leisingera aquimarina TaxID=476529 RepID=UPI0012EC0E49|nr:hypothetical protein [Leisingera aquimarina]
MKKIAKYFQKILGAGRLLVGWRRYAGGCRFIPAKHMRQCRANGFVRVCQAAKGIYKREGYR